MSGSPVSPNLVRPGITVCESEVSRKAASSEREKSENMSSGVGADAEDGNVGTRTPVIAPMPKGPTQAETAAHEPLHFEYRSWCPACVFGRGHSAHHRVVEKDNIEATWHMDYSFLGDKCEIVDEGNSVDGNATLLMAYDELNESCWTMQVPKKGPAPGVAKWCCHRLEDLGYGGNKIRIKSDQEESIVALRKAVAFLR